MKKKFVLTLALVLMVAVGLSAATPIQLSGEFKAGYNFQFNPTAVTNAQLGDNAGNYADAVDFTVSSDFWKVTFVKGIVMNGDSNNQAVATILLDKALAAQGVDMGDLTVSLAIGSKGTLKPADVYTDTNDAVYELETFAGPIGGPTTGNSFDVTVGYGSLLKVYAGSNPTDTTNKPFVLGVTTTPVDGIKAGFGYANYAIATKDGNGVATSTSAGITGSVTVDVAALADLDFGLSVSAIDIYHFEDSISGGSLNRLYAEVNASFGDVGAWAEYQLIDKKNNLKASASYSGIENVGLSASVKLEDLTNTITTTIGAGANYTMGGVKYALDAEYVVDGTFTLTPSVYIAF